MFSERLPPACNATTSIAPIGFEAVWDTAPGSSRSTISATDEKRTARIDMKPSRRLVRILPFNLPSTLITLVLFDPRHYLFSPHLQGSWFRRNLLIGTKTGRGLFET